MSSIWNSLYAEATAIFEAIGGVLASFGINMGGTGSLVKTIIEGISKVVRWSATGVIKAVTFVEVCFTQFPNTLKIVFLSAGLAIIGFALDVKHFFTVKLPAWIGWFGNHWREVFTDLWNITKTIFSNLWTNVKGLWDAIWNYLKGDGWEFDWTPLTDGFKSAITELPEIAERELTDVEKKMGAALDKARGEWGAEYNKKVTDRLARLDAGKDEKPETDATKPTKPEGPAALPPGAAKAIEGQVKIISSSRFDWRGIENSPQVKLQAAQLDEQKRTNGLLENMEMGGIE